MRSVLTGYYSNLAKMARQAPPSNRQAFSSIDEYAEALGHRDLRIMALGRERAPWEMSRVNLDGILVRSARDGGPCLIEAGLAADGVALLVGINAVGKMGANGAMFGRRSVMVIPARSEVRCTSLDSLEWLSVFIPTSRFDSTTGASEQTRRIPCGVIEPTPSSYRAYRELMQRVATAAIAGAFDANPVGKRHAADELVAKATGLLGHSLTQPADEAQVGRPRLSRAEIVDRAQQWLEAHGAERPSLRALSMAAGVSDRTLHQAFREQLGVSPKRFLRLRLLNTARRELRRAEPEATRVTDVMSALGIWDWGRFSGQYKGLFGEWPSETLQGSGRRHR